MDLNSEAIFEERVVGNKINITISPVQPQKFDLLVNTVKFMKFPKLHEHVTQVTHGGYDRLPALAAVVQILMVTLCHSPGC